MSITLTMYTKAEGKQKNPLGRALHARPGVAIGLLDVKRLIEERIKLEIFLKI